MSNLSKLALRKIAKSDFEIDSETLAASRADAVTHTLGHQLAIPLLSATLGRSAQPGLTSNPLSRTPNDAVVWAKYMLGQSLGPLERARMTDRMRSLQKYGPYNNSWAPIISDNNKSIDSEIRSMNSKPYPWK